MRVDASANVLMTQDYTLWHGDCLEILPTIESNSVDAILSDPPYPYIKRDYGYWTEAEWLPMMQEVVRQSRRILKPTGSAVFILQPNSEKVGKMRLWLWKFMVWAGEEWGIVQDAYWWNYAAMPLGGAPSLGLMRPSVKMCLWLGNENCYRNQAQVLWTESDWNKNRRLSDRANGAKGHRYITPSGRSMHTLARTAAAEKNGGTTPFNVLLIENDGFRKSGNGDKHSAPTPLKLSDWWLRYISKPGDTILDMFSGTGTTGVAALPLDRNYIGIERYPLPSQSIGDKNPDYFGIAIKRLARVAAELRGELNHLPMFAEAA